MSGSSSLWERFRSTAMADPDAVAVIGGDGQPTTAGRLLERAELAATGLSAIGLRPGQHLGIFLPNRTTWLVAALAAARCGVGVLGLNTRFRTTELEHLLSVAEVDTVVLADRFFGNDGPAIMAEVNHQTRLLVDRDPDTGSGAVPAAGSDPTPSSGGDIAWSVIEAGGPSDDRSSDRPGPTRQPQPDDPVIGFTTSGTTGLPKIAMHDHGQTVAHLDAVVERFGLDRTTVSLVPLPLCGAFGYTVAMATLVAGGRVVLNEAWDPDRAAADIAGHGVTFFSASDDMLLAVGASPSFDPSTTWRTGGFADFTNAGADAVARLDHLTGGVTRLAGLYGSSEGFALMSTFDHDDPIDRRAVNGGYLVGRAMQVRACDPETGSELGHGEAGELQFRGPNLITSYLNAPEATERAFTEDGWYRSGDLGHTLEPDDTGREGFVYLARMGDALRLRGFLCDPSEIESHLERHPSVALAQVVGVTKPGAGTVAVAFVRLDDALGADSEVEAALIEHCRHGLANYKRPERVIAVDEFPVTDGPNGVKIRKVDLRDRAAQLLGSSG